MALSSQRARQVEHQKRQAELAAQQAELRASRIAQQAADEGVNTTTKIVALEREQAILKVRSRRPCSWLCRVGVDVGGRDFRVCVERRRGVDGVPSMRVAGKQTLIIAFNLFPGLLAFQTSLP